MVAKRVVCQHLCMPRAFVRPMCRYACFAAGVQVYPPQRAAALSQLLKTRLHAHALLLCKITQRHGALKLAMDAGAFIAERESDYAIHLRDPVTASRMAAPAS